MSSKTAASSGAAAPRRGGRRGSIASRLQFTIVAVIGLFVGVWTLVLDVALVRAFDAGGVVRSSTGDWPVGHHVDWAQTGPTPRRFAGPGGGRLDALCLPVALAGGTGQVRVTMDRSHEDEIVDDYRRVLWGGLVVLLLVVVIASRLVVEHGLRPLAAITAQVHAVAPQHLDLRRDTAEFPIELATLVTALDATLARIDDAFGRLGRLSSDLAHELRTPLQNMRVEVEALVLRRRDRSPAAGAAAQQDAGRIASDGAGVVASDDASAPALGSLLEELDRLGDMTEQILSLARAEDPRKALACASLVAATELTRAASFFEASAAEAGVAVVVEVGDAVRVDTDAGPLQRVLHNLLANAIRYAGSGRQVGLGARAGDDGGACLWVSDSGEGTTVELQQRIGERFLRDDPSRQRGSGGAGLGLAIVARIADLRGGRLQVHAAPGQGTRIEIHLPDGGERALDGAP